MLERLFTIAAVLLAQIVFAGAAYSATIVVPDDTGSIVGALQLATNGDVVIVRPGIYIENIEFYGKAVTLVSEQGPRFTVIDGNQSGSVVKFINGEGPDSVLSGFTITNGTGTRRLSWNRYYGGGIRCHQSSPTIVYNIVTDNSVRGGDGIGGGGGIYCWDSSPVIESNTISFNIGFEGGGICCTLGSPTIRSNTFIENEAWYGGGLFVVKSGARIVGNRFLRNIANYNGGGIACQAGAPIIENNLIADNIAHDGGGGVYLEFDSYARIVNNTIVNNVVLRPTTGSGGAIACLGASPNVCNTILFNNQAAMGKEIYLRTHPNPSVLTIQYSDIGGGISSVGKESGSIINWGAGIIDADPLFADPASGDYHLTYGSPCRNAGLNHPLLSEEDFEGDPRISIGRVDIGADEFYFHLYHAGNPTPGGAVDFRVVGGPGMPVLLGHSLAIQDPPQPTAWGDLFLTMPPLWSRKIGTIPANGVLSLPITVPAFWNPGDEKYFQALAGAPGGPQTTLTNLETLEVE